jgi:hypothetical protein
MAGRLTFLRIGDLSSGLLFARITVLDKSVTALIHLKPPTITMNPVFPAKMLVCVSESISE